MDAQSSASAPLFSNDAVICGIIVGIIALVFYTSSLQHPFWRRFYTVCPKLLLCYFLPAILSTIGVFSAEESDLYFVASRYFLPASLVLLTLPANLREMMRLGPKALGVFFAGTVGVVIGGPLALLALDSLFPSFVAQYSLYEIAGAFSTLAGSWIGGGANQAAMKEIFGVEGGLFAIVLTVDVLVGNILLMALLIGAGKATILDKWLKARTEQLDQVQQRIQKLSPEKKGLLSTTNLLILSAVGLSVTALGHIGGDLIAPALKAHYPQLARYSLTSSFFWIIIIATTGGLLLSLSPARKLESKGASEVGSAFLYFLVATIGMGMDLSAIFRHAEVFLIGLLWVGVHITCLLVVARLLRAPFFFVAVGSQANIGGAASAPVVAGAFHPKLAPVGAMLAVFGYALGTYAAYLCGLWMQWLAS